LTLQVSRLRSFPRRLSKCRARRYLSKSSAATPRAGGGNFLLAGQELSARIPCAASPFPGQGVGRPAGDQVRQTGPQAFRPAPARFGETADHAPVLAPWWREVARWEMVIGDNAMIRTPARPARGPFSFPDVHPHASPYRSRSTTLRIPMTTRPYPAAPRPFGKLSRLRPRSMTFGDAAPRNIGFEHRRRHVADVSVRRRVACTSRHYDDERRRAYRVRIQDRDRQTKKSRRHGKAGPTACIAARRLPVAPKQPWLSTAAAWRRASHGGQFVAHGRSAPGCYQPPRSNHRQGDHAALQVIVLSDETANLWRNVSESGPRQTGYVDSCLPSV